jgi:hypothetical protein
VVWLARNQDDDGGMHLIANQQRQWGGFLRFDYFGLERGLREGFHAHQLIP